MPLTKSGKKVMAKMKSVYGSKKGKSVFYASINKGKPGSSKWHGKMDKGFYGHMMPPKEMEEIYMQGKMMMKEKEMMMKGKMMGKSGMDMMNSKEGKKMMSEMDRGFYGHTKCQTLF